jgi:hypothetical protein
VGSQILQSEPYVSIRLVSKILNSCVGLCEMFPRRFLSDLCLKFCLDFCDMCEKCFRSMLK